MLFWSSSQILGAIRMNKFLFGEFRVFRGKNDHYWLWALPWKFGGKIKLNRMKFILFLVMVLSIDWVAFSEMKWHEIRVIRYKVFRVG